jgi:hypothetical protein
MESEINLNLDDVLVIYVCTIQQKVKLIISGGKLYDFLVIMNLNFVMTACPKLFVMYKV